MGPQWGRLIRAQVLAWQGDVDASRAELARLGPGNDRDEDWLDLQLRRRRLEARHLQLAGDLGAAQRLVTSIVIQAAETVFKVQELETRMTGCTLEPERDTATKCFDQVRSKAFEIGHKLLLRRIEEVRKL